MRYIQVLFMALSAIAVAQSCKKHTRPSVTSVQCASGGEPITYAKDSNGLYYFVPNAFTPNGDGKNDRFGIITGGVDTAKSVLVVSDWNDRVVYSGPVYPGWDGTSGLTSTAAVSSYMLRVEASLMTDKGISIPLSTCVARLSNSSCIPASAGYRFEDQVDPATGFIYPTTETICP